MRDRQHDEITFLEDEYHMSYMRIYRNGFPYWYRGDINGFQKAINPEDIEEKYQEFKKDD